MKLIFSLAALTLSACAAAPAAAQTVSGCGTTAIAKADANNPAKLGVGAECFGKAKAVAAAAEAARRNRIAAITPAPAPSPTPTPSPAPPAPLPPQQGKAPIALRDRVGVNVAGSVYWAGERTFANLAKGASVWQSNWADLPADKLDAAGYPIVDATLLLMPPPPVYRGATVRVTCTWSGAGAIGASGYAAWVSAKAGSITFDWKPNPGQPSGEQRVWLTASGYSAAAPLRDLDCREPGMDRSALFAPEILSFLKPFGVLRMLDVSAANSNPPSVTLTNRSRPGRLNYDGSDGMAYEDMVALANQVGSSPWFTIPWNADDGYLRAMAQYAHDTVPAGRMVYVENSNEVWNWSFGVAGQANNEGLAEKLTDQKYLAGYLRYAERTAQVMKIWTAVYADRPADLVRVVSGQAGNSWVGEQILGFGDLAKYADAYAVAPYFGGELFAQNPGVTDHNKLMTGLEKNAAGIFDPNITGNAAVAKKYNLRLVAYEAGQHVLPSLAPAGVDYAAIERDPRMGDIYAGYLSGWASTFGDLMTLYAATGAINQYGAWGMREYSGQPISETPKLKAALDFVGGR